MLINKVIYHLQTLYANKYKQRPLGVAMFHFGRCGSTVVSELLNQNSNIKWDNELFQIIKYSSLEIFDTRFEKDYLKILENRYSRTKQKVYGFETKAIEDAHLGKYFLNMNFDIFLSKLLKLGFSKFIILKRTNFLRQILSVERGIQNKKFHYYKNDKIKIGKILFDPHEIVYGDYKGDMLEIFRKIENQYATIEKALDRTKIEYLILNYENDIESNPLNAYKQIIEYCKLPNEKAKVLQFKIGNKKVLEEIENPNQLFNYLKGTPYEWMIQD